jgi:hypothetical protein
MKRTLLRSGLLLLLLVAVVALVPALRIRAVGWFRGEMFLRGMPYSHWVDRLGEPKTLGPAEDELKAAGASATSAPPSGPTPIWPGGRCCRRCTTRTATRGSTTSEPA